MYEELLHAMRQNCFDAMPETPLQRGNALTIPVLCLALQVAMGGTISSFGLVCLGERSSNEQLLQRPKYLATCHFFQPTGI